MAVATGDYSGLGHGHPLWGLRDGQPTPPAPAGFARALASTTSVRRAVATRNYSPLLTMYDRSSTVRQL